MGSVFHPLQIEFIDASTSGGMVNWNEHCRYATVEAFGSNDISKIAGRMFELLKYNNEGMKDKVEVEIKNLVHSFNNALQKNNWESKSMAALIKTIDGQFVQHEPAEKKLLLLKDLSVKATKDYLENTKKKSKKNWIFSFLMKRKTSI